MHEILPWCPTVHVEKTRKVLASAFLCTGTLSNRMETPAAVLNETTRYVGDLVLARQGLFLYTSFSAKSSLAAVRQGGTSPINRHIWCKAVLPRETTGPHSNGYTWNFA